MATILSSVVVVHAEIGDNIGGGSGGGGGTVTDGRYTYDLSNPQGYRVTLITSSGDRVSSSIDVTNDASFAKQVSRHFDFRSKLDYLSGRPLLPKSTSYKFTSMPSNVTALPNALDFNIEAIKTWFTTGKNLRWLCEPDKLNFDFTKLANSKDYKLLIEPLVYIRIPTSLSDKSGSIYAMTATEGTLASQKDAQIAYNLAAILRRQLPISMYLEFDDTELKLDAYTGKTSWGNNEYIPYSISKSLLGLGIIYFTELGASDKPTTPPEKPEEKPEDKPNSDFDFSVDRITLDTSPVREENDFTVTSVYSYQQIIDCKYCVTECSQCNLSGSYEVMLQDEYFDHFGYCSVYDGFGCSCGMYYVPPLFETRQCTLCSVNCERCEEGSLWYNSGLSGEYPAPTKSVEITVFVKDAKLDYTKGTTGVLSLKKDVTMTADTPYELTSLMNAGEGIGQKEVITRINWEGRNEEQNPDNNEGKLNINVIPATNLTLEYLPPNAPYRTGTEVMTSYLVLNKEDIGALNIRPKHNLTAVLTVTNPNTGRVIAKQPMEAIVVPKGGSNIIYFKWLLPADYREESVKLSCHLNPSGNVKETLYSDNIHNTEAQVQIFHQNITPDTVFENRPAGFQRPSGYEEIPTSKWAASVFNSVSYERWIWSANDYLKQKYELSLEIDYTVTPDSKSPSHKQLSDKLWMMRSGYGVEISAKATISSNLPQDAYTPLQNGNIYLPEYRFGAGIDRFRSLEVVSTNTLNFPKNPNTITNKGEQDFKRVHFLPLWYPDGVYQLKAYMYDCWSPVGMLSKVANVNQIQVDGNMYDDWYLQRFD